MAKKTKITAGYEITVDSAPDFCGVGAGGVQFAYGKAQITAGRMVEWFREHEGYTVAEIAAPGGEEDNVAPSDGN